MAVTQLSLLNNGLRKEAHKRKVRARRFPTAEQIHRLLTTKNLYDQYGTLEEVGKQLSLTKERVRQLLIKGQEYQLFKYELTREKDFNDLINKVSKEKFIGAIKNNPDKYSICSELNIGARSYFKLSKFYQIEINDYANDARQKKYLIRYSNIVEALGHHPSTTEMNKRPNWRATWMAIDRIWGSIEKFRRAYGIEKPEFKIHPNTVVAFQKSLEKKVQQRREKVSQIKNLIINGGPISTNNISKILGLKVPTVFNYITRLLNENMIRRVGNGRTIKYIAVK